MKRKIQIINKENKVLAEKTFNTKNSMYEQLKKYKARIFKNKKTYSRKEKHKGRINDDSSFL